MDWSAIGAITASVTAMTDIAKGIANARDSSLVNTRTAQLQDQLLELQNRLLSHFTSLAQLQAELVDAQRENLEMKNLIQDRGKYTLVEVVKGQFAMQSIAVQHADGAVVPGVHEPQHYVCQPCFAKGIKAVLQGCYAMGSANGVSCPVCNAHLHI